jgi:glycosyltransferase involved in cell wall biosynthesis
MPDRRPISFLLPSLEPGGAERKTVILANGFAARGREVDLCVAINADGLLRREVHPAVRVVPLNIGRSRYFFFPVRRYLLAARPRVLACVMHPSAMFGIIAKASTTLGTPIVVLEGGMRLARMRQEEPKRVPIFKAQLRFFYGFAKRILANSQPIADELIDDVGLPARKIQVIYNPSAVAVFEDDDRSIEPPDDWPKTDAPVVITVSRLDENKDVATLVRAFAIVRATRPLTLVVLGDGVERAALERLARDLGVADDVHLLGAQPKPWRYSRHAAVFAMSPRTEGFSNALIEAMATGCPVVSTDAPGGTALILGDGVYGGLVAVGDHEAMAGEIVKAIDTPPDRTMLIDRAHSFGEAQIDAYLHAIEQYAC